jgi:hypothetical protein
VAGEGVESLLDGVQVGEVVRGECFALHDGEVDLGLVDPARVDGVCTRTRFGQAA